MNFELEIEEADTPDPNNENKKTNSGLVALVCHFPMVQTRAHKPLVKNTVLALISYTFGRPLRVNNQ